MLRKKPELLAPAGTPAALSAAIEGGADAVYFGAAEFNARMRAGNFGGEELEDALRLCRAYGVKSYITMNTRLLDRELERALRLAAELYGMGADALIVADMGLAAELKKQLPELELHASTQLSGHTVSDARALMEAGFSRMVCPREISAPELTCLCGGSPIEIEMFIHGAYCVSFSGQCLMSSVMGGRSGNRGSCAQPCRQPYSVGGRKGYPLSLKDMCLGSHITEIMGSGAASLKIEGRQKPPEYVYGVTRIYRRLLDEGRNANADEERELRSLFSRQGFTDGYYRGKAGGMTGIRTYSDYAAAKGGEYTSRLPKIPCRTEITAREGEPVLYTVSAGGRQATASAQAPVRLPGSGEMTYEGAKRCASRLGSTPYVLEDFEYSCDSGVFLTQSALNSLRRSAVEGLLAPPERAVPELSYTALPDSPAQNIIYTAEFSSPSQVCREAEEFFSEIYLPPGCGGGYSVSLPPVCFDGESTIPWDKLSGRVMVHTTGQLYEAAARGLCAVASMRLNVTNSACAEALGQMGASAVTLSPELNAAQMRGVSCSAKKAVIAYGRLPVMLLYRCVLSDGGKSCTRGGRGFGGSRGGGGCRGELRDRRGASFPVIAQPDCTNIVFNSVPVYMADRAAELRRTGADILHFIFTTETPEMCRRIIESYKNGEPPKGAAVMRIK